MISNEGFSVVAPISRILPFSTCGKNASCCALLKRWISSMKTMVRVPNWRAFSASAITCLISLMPESTAENSMKSALVTRAIIFASVVLPTPGGPQKMIEPGSSRSICSRSGLPGPSRCSWPTNSSSVRGRMRSASGVERSGGSSGRRIGLNKLTIALFVICFCNFRSCRDLHFCKLPIANCKFQILLRVSVGNHVPLLCRDAS